MTPMTSLAQWAQELASGRITATAAARQALERAQDPTGEGPRTYTHIAPDRSLALAAASDALRQAGLVRSPLEGVPISIKDVFDWAGQTTAAASRVLQHAPPAVATAPAVQRLLDAGAVLIGRSNMTEFAFSGLGLNPHHGTPRNPWGRQPDGSGRIPGGSSSGAAISVTDGMAALALGSLTGFKPTQRRVPMQGTLPLSTSLDSAGPIAPSVRCCITADAILSGRPAAELPARPLAHARLLCPSTLVLDELDEAVAADFSRALRRLRQAGAHITEAALPELAEVPALNARGSLSNAQAWAWHRPLIAERASAYDPRVRVRIEAGRQMDCADYIHLLEQRRRWQERMHARLRGYDALVMPTVPAIAPPIAALQNDDAAYWRANALMLRNPSLINFLDGCAISLPMHAPGQPPTGLMLAAPAMQDLPLLALALSAEAALRHA